MEEAKVKGEEGRRFLTHQERRNRTETLHSINSILVWIGFDGMRLIFLLFN